eukprot:jgi/Orpsp1_1/1176435/evm.model.c7180000057575.1
MVKLLMEYADDHNIALDINQKSENGIYPLITAIAKNKNIEMVKLLIEYANRKNITLDIDQKCDDGSYPLLYAISIDNSIEMIKVIVEYAKTKHITLSINENDIKNISDVNDDTIKLLLDYEKEHIINIQCKDDGKFMTIKELPDYESLKNTNINQSPLPDSPQQLSQQSSQHTSQQTNQEFLQNQYQIQYYMMYNPQNGQYYYIPMMPSYPYMPQQNVQEGVQQNVQHGDQQEEQQNAQHQEQQEQQEQQEHQEHQDQQGVQPNVPYAGQPGVQPNVPYAGQPGVQPNVPYAGQPGVQIYPPFMPYGMQPGVQYYPYMPQNQPFNRNTPYFQQQGVPQGMNINTPPQGTSSTMEQNNEQNSATSDDSPLIDK